MSRRAPNLLLLMADQCTPGALPAYGNRVVQTPHLSALAADAVTFEAAYCASPLCTPSRMALLTGRRASAVGAYDNAAELPASVPTVTHRLRAAGYSTCLAGKMHFVGPDQLHGFEERLTTDVYPADLDWTPDWRLAPDERLPWYHNASSILEAGPYEAAMQTDYDDEVAFRAVRRLFDYARDDDGRPFFLVVSFTNPHDPWELPRRHWDRYRDEDVPLPHVPTLPLEAVDPHSRRLRVMYGTDERPFDEAEIRRARHGYYAALGYMDEQIGRVLGALEAAGLAEETAVLFTSDHGEMLGERGLWYKMSFFEGSARVPLLVRAPGLAPRRVAEPVSLVDLAPTLLELAGVESDRTTADGTGLAPLLTGTGPGPAAVLGEYLAEGVQAPAVMIRRGRHKYVHCPTDPDQLYDLAADPHELDNLADDPEQAATRDAFREEVAARWDLAALTEQVLASQRDRRTVVAGLAEGAYQAWDFQPFVDATAQYVRHRRDLYDLQRRSRLPSPGGDGSGVGRTAGTGRP